MANVSILKFIGVQCIETHKDGVARGGLCGEGMN